MTIHRKLKLGLLVAGFIGILVVACGFLFLPSARYPGHALVAIIVELVAVSVVFVRFRRVIHDEQLPNTERRYR